MNQRKSLLIDLGSGGGGTLGRWGNPVRWDNPPVHLISHFVRSRSFTGRVTRREGLPDLPDGVILSAGLTCKRFRWGYQPSWGRIGVTSNSRHIRTITIKSDNS